MVDQESAELSFSATVDAPWGSFDLLGGLGVLAVNLFSRI